MDLRAHLDHVHDAAQALLDREPLDPLSTCALWREVVEAAADLDAARRDVEASAVDALATLGLAAGQSIMTPSGPVLAAMRSGYTRWRGRALLDALADDHVDRLGEVIRAVPLDVLVQVIPGCADYDATSSRWLARGVGQLLPLNRYRTVEDATPTIRLGD